MSRGVQLFTKVFVLLSVLALIACAGPNHSPKLESKSSPKPEIKLSPAELEQQFIAKSASYYCYGDKNFMPCINRNIELETQACVDYVVKNSRRCIAKHIKGQDLSEPGSVKKIGVAYTQCSMVEMLANEGVQFQNFERCFKVNYRQSDLHPKLN